MSTDAPGSQPPVPQYGEYTQAPSGPPPYQPNYTPMGGQPQQQLYYGQPYVARRPLRTADAIVSIVLLVLGFFGMIMACIDALDLESVMQSGLEGAGVTTTYVPNGSFVAVQAIIIASHLALFFISTPIAIVLIIKRKLSFWIPLTAGVIAALIFWGSIFVLLFTDPAFQDAVQHTQR